MNGILADVKEHRVHKHIHIQRGVLGAAGGCSLALTHTIQNQSHFLNNALDPNIVLILYTLNSSAIPAIHRTAEAGGV